MQTLIDPASPPRETYRSDTQSDYHLALIYWHWPALDKVAEEKRDQRVEAAETHYDMMSKAWASGFRESQRPAAEKHDNRFKTVIDSFDAKKGTPRFPNTKSKAE